MKSLVLVDFDGVVLRNQKASSFINRKVESYIAKRTPLREIGMITAFNKELYTSYGHTLIGLKKNGFKVSLEDFNNYVYGDPKEYNDLTFTDDERDDFEWFLEDVKEAGCNVQLFSNSSAQWMRHFLGGDDEILEFHKHIDNFMGEPFYDRLLKPERCVYDVLMSKYQRQRYIFVDDKVCNFGYIARDPRWSNLWFYPSGGKSQVVGPNIYAINSLETAGKKIRETSNRV